MSDLPTEIRIGGIKYKVEVLYRLAFEAKRIDGHIDYSHAVIQLDSELNSQIAQQTIWHEVIHAILVQAGMPTAVKESAVDALAYGIVQVLRDNPGLVVKEPVELSTE